MGPPETTSNIDQTVMALYAKWSWEKQNFPNQWWLNVLIEFGIVMVSFKDQLNTI